MLQTIIVYLVIAVVFIILVRNAVRMFTRKKDDSHCSGCSGCGTAHKDSSNGHSCH